MEVLMSLAGSTRSLAAKRVGAGGRHGAFG